MTFNEHFFNSEEENNLKQGIRELMSQCEQNKPVHPEMYKNLREIIIDKLLYNETKNASDIRITDEYKYSHPINVSIFATILGLRLNFDIDELKSICLAGLLFDIGKLRIPEQIMNKQGALTPKEFEIIKLHAPLGYKIIKEEFNLSEDIARPALEHHEKFDGSGYPRKLQRDAIGYHSQIIAICDVFDAIISAKSYGTNKPYKEGLKIVLGYGSSWFNPSILYTFVHSAGFKD